MKWAGTLRKAVPPLFFRLLGSVTFYSVPVLTEAENATTQLTALSSHTLVCLCSLNKMMKSLCSRFLGLHVFWIIIESVTQHSVSALFCAAPPDGTRVQTGYTQDNLPKTKINNKRISSHNVLSVVTYVLTHIT